MIFKLWHCKAHQLLILPPPTPTHRTKCCYGLSMDLLENVATELGFQFHLYLVRDELYGAKYSAMTNAAPAHNTQSSAGDGIGDVAVVAGPQMTRDPNNYGDVEIESDWDQSNGKRLSSFS